ncbi:ABC transporter ATP-binding protein [Rhodoferax sp.]|uniref:ABC transporter ATP-binding protein n=1 Tax=Rhodoferax sp. TaxID=50421 RepID=UPI002730B13A|nr:ABC transporter ATP-binding protein [Rhodoferax sp.]MDP1529932.1 ABC transporter ATP-binding protein [Rhodoferax sp.]MDP1942705.1 ABC transporter ATP-binding protein [Rhodoferax sp.]MDP2443480.1 ABC transporter ATP-binding protein [Rhodoferax sp.]MDZ4206271.1 ABC transporter ATP-binding protein [Rhodoferax sp.]
MSHSTLLQVDDLVKSYGGLRATDHASLSVLTGEIHALIGPNGAGKTTLIQLISGALAPSAGRIEFDGMDITRMPMHARVAHGLARSFQITSIFHRLSVLDNLALAVLAHAGHSLNFWRPARRDAERYALAFEVAQRVGLGLHVHRLGGALSHGEQRQLELGLALATRPKLLLLDEPMAGMGPDESERMLSLLQSLRGETTLLLVEHDMNAVFRLADRISTLVAGRVIACGTPEEIRRHPEVRLAYLGDDEEATA